jgi:ribosomal protein S18 acetylase RimI-like enzyme
MSLMVRLASPDEYEAVGRVTLDAYVADGFLVGDDEYAGELVDAATRGREAELVVAVDSETADVVGTVTYCPPGSPWRELSSGREGEFRMLAVAPATRGRGIGRALVQFCVDRTAELGLSGLTICSLPEMTTAHRLYASFGFQRAPDLDWQPVEGFTLWAFVRPRSSDADRA